MTQQEYEQKKAECWHEYFSSDKQLTTIHEHEVSKDAFYIAFDRAYALGKQEKDADTVIQGWVARDKNGDLVCCAGSKPFKEEKMPFWRVDFRNFIECIPNDLFPNLTWESDPIEVEIIIKRKKK